MGAAFLFLRFAIDDLMGAEFTRAMSLFAKTTLMGAAFLKGCVAYWIYRLPFEPFSLVACARDVGWTLVYGVVLGPIFGNLMYTLVNNMLGLSSDPASPYEALIK